MMRAFDRQQARHLRAQAEEDGVVVLAEVLEAADAGTGVDRDAQHADLVELLLEQVRRQAIRRDAITQHAAGLLLRLEDLDVVAVGAQVVRSRQAGRPGADDADPLAGIGGDLGFRISAIRQAVLGRLGLQRPDEDRAVAAAAHAGRFAWRRTDQPAGQRQRVVAPDDLDGGTIVAIAEVGHEGRDVDVGRAGAVARRGIALEAQPLRAGLAPRVAFPLRAKVAQRTAQRPRCGEPLRLQFQRERIERSKMTGFAAPEGDLGDQARGARQQPAYRRGFAFGEQPVAIQRAPRLLDHAHARRHHHQRRWSRHDARLRKCQRFARQVRLRQRQVAAEAVVEHEQRVLAFDLDTAAPGVDLPPQIAGAIVLDQAALLHAAAQGQQRCIGSRCAREQQRDPAPGLGCVHQPRSIAGRALAPATRLAVAQHVDALARARHLRQCADGIDRVEERAFVTGQLGRQAQFDRAALAQSDGDQQSFGQQPGRAGENGRGAPGALIEAGGVDHQHRRPVPAQEPAPREMNRLTRARALGEPGLLHALQALQRRQRLRAGEARQGTGKRRRRRHGARQGGRIGIEPCGQQLAVRSWPLPIRRRSHHSCRHRAPPPRACARSARAAGRALRWRGRTTGSPSRTW